METQNALVSIPCPLHPSEYIQRVDMNINSDKQFYCLECILQHEDPSSLSSQLKTIKDLIEIAGTFYLQNKTHSVSASEVPGEYQGLLSHQGEKLEQLTKHIEEEKKKVTNAFETLTEDVIRMINDKKNEYLYSLDQQLFKLRYWYIFFDKQLKKAYPTEDDIPFLFPTKEDLVKRLQKITNTTQLMAFVRNLKEDLNEKKLGFIVGSHSLEEARKTHLQTLSKELINVENLKPRFENEEEISKIKEEMRNHLEDTLGKLFVFEKSIPDVVQGKNFDSKVLSSEQFELIKKWLPANQSKKTPKLLYRGTRDGMNGQGFHKLCDGKGPTITVIKCKFNGSSKTSIIGGYLDKDWNQSGQYIQSTEAFIFSVTTKVKCSVTQNAYAGYGNSAQGPVFGSGHDLAIMGNNLAQSYVNPSGYSNTAKIVEVDKYKAGQTFFTPMEIEVYKI